MAGATPPEANDPVPNDGEGVSGLKSRNTRLQPPDYLSDGAWRLSGVYWWSSMRFPSGSESQACQL